MVDEDQLNAVSFLYYKSKRPMIQVTLGFTLSINAYTRIGGVFTVLDAA